jgi:hypothetical protein
VVVSGRSRQRPANVAIEQGGRTPKNTLTSPGCKATPRRTSGHGNRRKPRFSGCSEAVWRPLKPGNGAQGRNRTADTVIFSHVLYQLSYLGIPAGAESGGAYKGASPSLSIALREKVGPAFRRRQRDDNIWNRARFAKRALFQHFVGRRARHLVRVAEPVEQVAVAAALAAEGGVSGGLRLAAERAGVAAAIRG